MRVTTGIVLAALAVAVAAAEPALGQTRGPAAPSRQAGMDRKVFVAVNGGYATAPGEFNDGATFRVHGEDGRFDSVYTPKQGSALDVSGGIRLWRHFGVGVGASRFSRDLAVTVTGSIPHPFFYDRPRAVSGDVDGLAQEGVGLHPQVFAVFGSGRIQITAFGGPSFVRVTHGVVTSFDYQDTYPFDQATFRQGVTRNVTASGRGGHVGGDVGYFFTQHVGVGFRGQVTRASVSLPSAGTGEVRVEAGGTQFGGGIRLRF